MAPKKQWSDSLRISPSQTGNRHGKINLSNQCVFGSHRHGWQYAIEALYPEHNPKGILLEGVIDQAFHRHLSHDVVYQKPWIGFLHNPPTMPSWFPPGPQVDDILGTDSFQRSLPACQGIFTLSNYLAEYLRSKVPVPVSVLTHPTAFPETKFDFQAFYKNPRKRVVSVGWWLRRQLSIEYLPLDAKTPYRKTRLLTKAGEVNSTRNGLARLEFIYERGKFGQLDSRFKENTENLSFLPNEGYDQLLSENIVFLDLYDSSANNAIIECIARATPLLVNPLPAVVEYLGDNYPLYFDSLEEAAEKALDFDLLLHAHEYLRAAPIREKLTGDYFLASLRGSEVYQGLQMAAAA